MRGLIFLALAASSPAALLAQSADPSTASPAVMPEPFDQSVADEAVSVLASKLEDNFVLPEIGKAYAAMLRANLASGKYAHFSGSKEFADAVTADLQAIHKDGHLKLHVVPPEARSGPEGENQAATSGPAGPDQSTNTISKSGWIAEGIAYIRFEAFFGTEATMSALRSFIDEHRGAK